MLLRSIKSNASFLFPRIGLFVVLAWLLWFVNSVVQSTVAYLRRQVRPGNAAAACGGGRCTTEFLPCQNFPASTSWTRQNQLPSCALDSGFLPSLLPLPVVGASLHWPLQAPDSSLSPHTLHCRAPLTTASRAR